MPISDFIKPAGQLFCDEVMESIEVIDGVRIMMRCRICGYPVRVNETDLMAKHLRMELLKIKASMAKFDDDNSQADRVNGLNVDECRQAGHFIKRGASHCDCGAAFFLAD